MKTANEVTEPRYDVQPPAGPCGSGFFSFWTIRDTHADLKDGNNVVDYYSDCMEGAEGLARHRAQQYNAGAVRPTWWGVSHGEPASA